MKIWIDDREKKTIPYAIKHWAGHDIEIKRLKVGDYVFPDLSIAIETKWSWKDAAGSTKDGRIFRQAERMAKKYKYSTIFIVGDFDKVYKDPYCHFSVNQKRGLFARLMSQNYSFSEEKSVESCFKQMDFYIKKCAEGPHVIKPKSMKRKNVGPEEQMLISIGVTAKQAEEILKVFTIRELHDVTKKQLMEIRGVGPRACDKVKGVFV